MLLTARTPPVPIFHSCRNFSLSLPSSEGTSGRASVVRIVIANRQVPGSNPPKDTGEFCDTTHIRPVMAIPETSTTGATYESRILEVLTKGGPLQALSRRGYRTVFRSESFPQLTGLQPVHSTGPGCGCRQICGCPMALGCGATSHIFQPQSDVDPERMGSSSANTP